jgi:hypothetical protein
MTEKPTKGPPSPRSSAPVDQHRLEQKDDPGERYGLVVVARHVKDDGRALIIYTSALDPPE